MFRLTAQEWIAGPVRERAPRAVLCADRFHVVGWATEALDEVRRGVWRAARQVPGAIKGPGPARGQALASGPSAPPSPLSRPPTQTRR